MPSVHKILAKVPAASRRTFKRGFIVKEFIASQAFSRSNGIQGALNIGAITDGWQH